MLVRQEIMKEPVDQLPGKDRAESVGRERRREGRVDDLAGGRLERVELRDGGVAREDRVERGAESRKGRRETGHGGGDRGCRPPERRGQRSKLGVARDQGPKRRERLADARCQIGDRAARRHQQSSGYSRSRTISAEGLIK